jgi:hypothetical protein
LKIDSNAQGAEILNNYGSSKPNEELLLGFGFCIDDNPNGGRQACCPSA